MIKSLDTFVELAKKKKGKKISIAAAEDSHVLEAMKMVLSENLAEPIFVGHKEKILKLADEIQLDISNFDIVNVEDPVKACYDAVKIVHDGSADVLMRGLVDSKYYLRAIFDKEIGLKKSKLVSQVAFIESPNYHKVFAYTDSGINIAPTLQDKITMINHAVEAFHNMGIANPKVAIIAASEDIKEAIPATTDAGLLMMKNKRGEIKGCTVDGPLSIDLAFSKESCEHKGIETVVGGDVDLILLPEINSANVFYKTITLLGNAVGASFICGTTAPIVFPSRSDTQKTKYYALAAALAQCK